MGKMAFGLKSSQKGPKNGLFGPFKPEKRQKGACFVPSPFSAITAFLRPFLLSEVKNE